MRNELIRKTVRTVLGNAGDVVTPVQLVRKNPGSYFPGTGAEVTETLFGARLVKTETPTGRSGIEVGGILDKAVHIGLLETEEEIPQADDDLLIGEARFTIIQAAPADLGAGILYEVWYQ